MPAPPYDQRLARRLVPALLRLGVSPNAVTAVCLLLELTAAGPSAAGLTEARAESHR
ncbi:MAG TPA: hypothetical protein VLL72_00410 [Kiloniellales bacterium]|nr:hypothetical protein [Kiloniellales bacterium]